MEKKEAILAEIKKQGIPLDALSERQLKSLLASIAMKWIYEPLPDAVSKSYKILEKEAQCANQK